MTIGFAFSLSSVLLSRLMYISTVLVTILMPNATMVAPTWEEAGVEIVFVLHFTRAPLYTLFEYYGGVCLQFCCDAQGLSKTQLSVVVHVLDDSRLCACCVIFSESSNDLLQRRSRKR